MHKYATIGIAFEKNSANCISRFDSVLFRRRLHRHHNTALRRTAQNYAAKHVTLMSRVARSEHKEASTSALCDHRGAMWQQ